MIKPVSNYNFYPKYSTSRNKVSFGQLNRIDFDVFESSSKPIEKKSQISKLIENTRLKFTISKIYDDLYEDMKKECDEKGINFVKPNLIFDKTDSSVDAALITGRNAIVFNTKYLGLDKFVKYKDGTIPFSRLDDDLEFPIVSFDADNISENQRYLKANEYLLEKASILRHELAHARQEQIMLSTNGGVEKFLEILNKKPQNQDNPISLQRLYQACPFYLKYVPKKEFQLNEKIPATLSIENTRKALGLEFSFTPLDIIKSLAGYKPSSESRMDNYINLLEIESMTEEAIFLSDECLMKKFNLSQEDFDYYSAIKKYAVLCFIQYLQVSSQSQ